MRGSLNGPCASVLHATTLYGPWESSACTHEGRCRRPWLRAAGTRIRYTGDLARHEISSQTFQTESLLPTRPAITFKVTKFEGYSSFLHTSLPKPIIFDRDLRLQNIRSYYFVQESKTTISFSSLSLWKRYTRIINFNNRGTVLVPLFHSPEERGYEIKNYFLGEKEALRAIKKAKNNRGGICGRYEWLFNIIKIWLSSRMKFEGRIAESARVLLLQVHVRVYTVTENKRQFRVQGFRYKYRKTPLFP